MSDDLIVFGQYVNSAACLGLMAMIYAVAWVSSAKHNRWATVALAVIVVPLGVQVLTPFLPGLLPPIAWSGVVLHIAAFVVAATACRKELWALVRQKTHAPPPAKHPMRRPEDFAPMRFAPISSPSDPTP